MGSFLSVVWNVDPVLFYIGDRGVRWYGLLLALGFLAGYLVLYQVLKKEGRNRVFIDKFAIYIIVGVIVGLRLGHCLFYDPIYYFTHPLEIFCVWNGGLASHGGAVGILVAIWLYARKCRLPYLHLLDRSVLIVPLAGAFVRIGNLMNHEIVGLPTTLPWSFKFMHNYEDWQPAIDAAAGTCPTDDLSCLANFWTARHPTQLYEAIFYIIMFAVFFFIFKKYSKKWVDGTYLGWFLTTMFVFRYLIEFTKEDPVEFEGWTNAITMGQLLSIPFVILGISLIIRGYVKLKKKQHSPVSPEA